MKTTTKTRLADFGTNHVWFTSLGQPAGCDLVLDADADCLQLPSDTLGGDGPWWELEGEVANDNGTLRWEWDGEGKPIDWRGNTVRRMVAFV